MVTSLSKVEQQKRISGSERIIYFLIFIQNILREKLNFIKVFLKLFFVFAATQTMSKEKRVKSELAQMGFLQEVSTMYVLVNG
jgi:hypothetical protein